MFFRMVTRRLGRELIGIVGRHLYHFGNIGLAEVARFHEELVSEGDSVYCLWGY